jgi:1-aminocyclopropane-1-carboxylate deaminase/D-cysteine desulfhydrase-like pyridoxal-dependent ACC family enzyme
VSPVYGRPTPTLECPALATAHARLYVKNDGLTHPVYGGNKVRKAERIVGVALARKSRRLVTFGAAGSHHVLTLALFAREQGLGVAAVLGPQVSTPHVERTLRASVAAGVEVFPAKHALGLGLQALRALRRGDLLVPPGGSNVEGALGSAEAMAELADDVRCGRVPEPDLVVVPVGSGGTAAGAVAGALHHGLRSRVVGVLVVRNPFARALVLGLAKRALAALGSEHLARDLADRLIIDGRFVGGGYGVETPAATRALEVARDAAGLELDQTYTAKSFAGALELLREPPTSGPRTVVYLHTLSAVPFAPLLEHAPAFDELPDAVRRLLVSSR